MNFINVDDIAAFIDLHSWLKENSKVVGLFIGVASGAPWVCISNCDEDEDGNYDFYSGWTSAGPFIEVRASTLHEAWAQMKEILHV